MERKQIYKSGKIQESNKVAASQAKENVGNQELIEGAGEGDEGMLYIDQKE